MKVFLVVLKQTQTAAVCSRRWVSSCARGGLSPLIAGSSRELVRSLGAQVEVRAAFITEQEEEAFLRELEPGLKKKRYEYDHWDHVSLTEPHALSHVRWDKVRVESRTVTCRKPLTVKLTNMKVFDVEVPLTFFVLWASPTGQAIHGYRETERGRWGAACEEVLSRVRSVAFPDGSPLLGPVHILDLDKSGYIKAHIDSVKFCGSTIAGLCLLSDSVMRLVKENSNKEWLDLLLPRHSLYILRDQARYNFTHEILKDEESVFNGQRVLRQRRISVICRNLPG